MCLASDLPSHVVFSVFGVRILNKKRHVKEELVTRIEAKISVESLA
jgi:hypothetical protein